MSNEDEVREAMGMLRVHDYAGNESTVIHDRLGRCYELAARGFLFTSFGHSTVPSPVRLVHGSWHGPVAPRRINHAWVTLSTGQVWEPITRAICNPDEFYRYTRADRQRTYTFSEAREWMLRTEHYGPWHEEVHHG